jgi:DNA-binding NtrC family response regulator
MNGIEMVQNILEMHAQAKVILMSRFTVAHMVTDTLKRACTVIEKPFTAERLIEAVHDVSIPTKPLPDPVHLTGRSELPADSKISHRAPGSFLGRLGTI